MFLYCRRKSDEHFYMYKRMMENFTSLLFSSLSFCTFFYFLEGLTLTSSESRKWSELFVWVSWRESTGELNWPMQGFILENINQISHCFTCFLFKPTSIPGDALNSIKSLKVPSIYVLIEIAPDRVCRSDRPQIWYCLWLGVVDRSSQWLSNTDLRPALPGKAVIWSTGISFPLSR